MARLNIKPFTKKLLSFLNTTVNKPVIMKALGNKAIELVQKNTRLSKGVDANGNKFNLKKSKKSYIDYREKQWSKNPSRMDKKTTRPTSSNLTFTGQLLRSLEVVTVNKNYVIVTPVGMRDRVGRSEPMANDHLANILQKKDGGKSYRFLDISNVDQKILFQFYRKKFGDLVKLKLT